MKSWTSFKIKSLNQEKKISKLLKVSKLYDFVRCESKISTFKVPFVKARKIRKELKKLKIDVLEEKNSGFLPFFCDFLKNAWILSAFFIAIIIYIFQLPIIWQYEVMGTENVEEVEIVSFVKENFKQNKNEINVKDVETAIYQNFDAVSFVSVIFKGQTMVINIKEKVMPNEVYGTFEPLVSDRDGKVTAVSLISGTTAVQVGDYVRAGDVLVYPYYTNADGQTLAVEAQALITLETYAVGQYTHFENQLEVVRTGNYTLSYEVIAFGLTIYQNKTENEYDFYETEEEIVCVTSGNILPIYLRKIYTYELEIVEIYENYTDFEEKILELARENAFQSGSVCDTIIEEFYTVKHIAGVSIVNYVIVGEKVIGEQNES